MPEIDPVIFEFHARVNGYLADINRTTRAVEQGVGRQEQRIKQLEREMARSSGAIGGHIRGLAAVFAGAFTGRELVGLLDNFTRLQNSLRVAGLEGQNLAAVQNSLLQTGARYGVQINSLADLYGKAQQAQQDLGASGGQLLQITTAAAQALKITGTSTQAASGAILGLTQALSSGIVRAEEFNQINEGGLRPLLQVVAAGERWGGSVAKLREDIADGKVTSQEFFRGILAGSEVLAGQASRATLTLAGGFTALTNSLTVYFGEADKANGVSAALGETLGALADNLDTIIPALATIATVLGVRYVVGATAAAGATVLASNAMFALQARALGAATSIEALSFAMQGMRGGIVTAAVLALGAAIYYTYQQTHGAAEATGRYAKALKEAEADTKTTSDAVDKLASAHGKARAAALAAAKAEAENARQKKISAEYSLLLAEAELARARARTDSMRESDAAAVQAGADPSFIGLGSSFSIGQEKERVAEANLRAAEQTNQQQSARLRRALDAVAGNTPAVGPVAGDKSPGRKRGGGRAVPAPAPPRSRAGSMMN